MQDNIVIIHTQFGPYHFARVKVLAQLYFGSVRLIQLASQEALRQWVVDANTPEVITVAQGTLETLAPKIIAQKLTNILAKIAPSIIIVAGYSHPAMRAAVAWARHHGVATVMLSDSQHLDRPRHPLKEVVKSTWIRRNFDAAFVAGASASFYLSSLGFPRDRIWRGYDVVDNNHFDQGAEVSRNQGDNFRKTLNLPERYFLYLGRFSPEKNLLRLLESYQIYHQKIQHDAWSLVLVGSGSQENALKIKATQLGLKNIFWKGFKQLEELPQYYGFASAFILPSISEPWGLVVNEAMACGLPILISDRCGCVSDLVFPGINGHVFDPFNVEKIANSMLVLSSKSDSQREKMKLASRQIIANYTPETWAESIIDCIQAISKR